MKLSYINLGEDIPPQPVCFSLGAIEALEDEFGSLEAMRQGLVDGKVKAINKVVEIMIDAGRAYCKGTGRTCPDPLPCRPADLIDISDSSIVSDLFSAMTSDSERKVETRKN